MHKRDPCSVDQLSTLSIRGLHNISTAGTDLDDTEFSGFGHERRESPSRIPVRRDRVQTEVARWLRHDQNERRKPTVKRQNRSSALTPLSPSHSLPTAAHRDLLPGDGMPTKKTHLNRQFPALSTFQARKIATSPLIAGSNRYFLPSMILVSFLSPGISIARSKAPFPPSSPIGPETYF